MSPPPYGIKWSIPWMCMWQLLALKGLVWGANKTPASGRERQSLGKTHMAQTVVNKTPMWTCHIFVCVHIFIQSISLAIAIARQKGRATGRVQNIIPNIPNYLNNQRGLPHFCFWLLTYGRTVCSLTFIYSLICLYCPWFFHYDSLYSLI